MGSERTEEALSRIAARPRDTRAVAMPRPGWRLPAMLTAAGHQLVTETSYDWDGRKRGDAAFALLQYTLAGAGELRFEGRRYRPVPGTAMLLTFPHDNRYWLPPGGHWRFFFLCLQGEQVLHAWREAIDRLGPLPRLGSGSEAPATAARACAAVLDGAVTTPWRASAWAYRVAMALLEDAAPAREGTEGRPEAVARAIALVRRAYHEPLDVERMAAEAGLSRYHFTRLFRASERLSPMDYLRRHRMREAARLLKTTDWPVKAVADEVGFRDARYFGKVFRRAFGVPPATFRDSGMYGPR